MTNAERERFKAVERAARALRNIWLQERDAQRAQQLAANAAIRKQWSEADVPLGKSSTKIKN